MMTINQLKRCGYKYIGMLFDTEYIGDLWLTPEGTVKVFNVEYGKVTYTHPEEYMLTDFERCGGCQISSTQKERHYKVRV